MREKSKALEDELGQLTEKYTACKRDWDKEVEENYSMKEHSRMAEFVSTISFFIKCSNGVFLLFSVCVKQKAALLEHINKAQQDLLQKHNEPSWQVQVQAQDKKEV